MSQKPPNRKLPPTLEPDVSALRWIGKNELRLVPIEGTFDDLRRISPQNVYEALCNYVHSSTIPSIVRIANSNIRYWTILFKNELAFEQVITDLQKPIQIQNAKFRVENTAVKAKIMKTFVFRFSNFPSGFDNENTIKDFLFNKGFPKNDIISIYRETLKNSEIETGVIRAKVQVTMDSNTMQDKIYPMTAKVQFAVNDHAGNTLTFDISVTRVGEKICNHCGIRDHIRKDCPKKESSCTVCLSQYHLSNLCPKSYVNRMKSKITDTLIEEDEVSETVETVNQPSKNLRENSPNLSSNQSTLSEQVEDTAASTPSKPPSLVSHIPQTPGNQYYSSSNTPAYMGPLNLPDTSENLSETQKRLRSLNSSTDSTTQNDSKQQRTGTDKSPTIQYL